MRRRRAPVATLGVAALVLGGLAACGSPPAQGSPGADGMPAVTAPSSVIVTPPTVQPTGPASPATSPEPTPVPVATPLATDQPPAAVLLGDGIGPPGLAGAEGTFTWDEVVSDAPWIVLPGAAVSGSGPWTVAFDPPLPAERWTTRWARVVDGVPRRPDQGTDGTGGSIEVSPPSTPGSWGVQVEAWFGPGRHATWYWTIDVAP